MLEVEQPWGGHWPGLNVPHFVCLPADTSNIRYLIFSISLFRSGPKVKGMLMELGRSPENEKEKILPFLLFCVTHIMDESKTAHSAPLPRSSIDVCTQNKRGKEIADWPDLIFFIFSFLCTGLTLIKIKKGKELTSGRHKKRKERKYRPVINVFSCSHTNLKGAATARKCSRQWTLIAGRAIAPNLCVWTRKVLTLPKSFFSCQTNGWNWLAAKWLWEMRTGWNQCSHLKVSAAY